MLGHEQFLKDLVGHKDGLKVHSIHFVEKAILDKDSQGQLNSIGLENFEPIFFSVNGDNYCKDGQLNASSSDYSALNGGTINIKVNGKIKQVILVQNDFPVEFDNDAEAQKDYEAMMQLIALSHELGHVQDMQLGSCSNFVYGNSPKVNLVEAEAYAHAHCLNYLHRVGAHTARNCMADTLYRLHLSKNRFEKQLYTSIGKKVGKGRMKKWRT